MAYNNYYPMGYQPLVYPQSNGYSSPQQPTPQNGIIWVTGEAGAKSYMVAPNQTVVLWDSEQDVVYIKSADASGMPNVKVLDYTIRDNGAQKAEILAQKDFATKDEVDYLRKELNALKSKFEVRKDGKK